MKHATGLDFHRWPKSVQRAHIDWMQALGLDNNFIVSMSFEGGCTTFETHDDDGIRGQITRPVVPPEELLGYWETIDRFTDDEMAAIRMAFRRWASWPGNPAVTPRDKLRHMGLPESVIDWAMADD